MSNGQLWENSRKNESFISSKVEFTFNYFLLSSKYVHMLEQTLYNSCTEGPRSHWQSIT